MQRNATRVSFAPLAGAIVLLFGAILAPTGVGCGEETPMNDTTYQSSGLYLTDSPDLAPAGALQKADNVILRDEGYLDPIRGTSAWAVVGGEVNALYSWRLSDDSWYMLAHRSNGTLYRIQPVGVALSRTGSTVTVTFPEAHGLSPASTFALASTSNRTTFVEGVKTIATAPTSTTVTYTEAGTATTATGDSTIVVAYSGTYTAPTGHPMRFWEAGGALYFTTNAGPYRLDSPTATPVPAGVPPGLEGKAEITGTEGWLNYGETVGYRVNLGRRDADGDLLLGSPSGRILLTNLADNGTLTAFTWTRAAAVITATDAAHGLSTGDSIVVTTSTDETAVPLGVYSITVTGVNTFTFTTVDAGGASGGAGNEYSPDDSGTRDALLTLPIPTNLTAGSDFVQVNRTVNTTTGGADPGEDFALVAEEFPTAQEIAAGSVTVQDIAPFANGATAYYSISEGGLLGSLEQPPLVTDAITPGNYTQVVLQAYRQNLPMSLVAIGGTSGLAIGQGLLFFVNGAYSFGVAANAAENVALGDFELFTTGTPAENLENTVRSLVRVLNGMSSSLVHATYASAENDTPGTFIMTAREVATPEITVMTFSNPNAWTPDVGARVFGTTISRSGTTVTVTLTPTSAVTSFEVGQVVEMTTVDPLPVDPDFPLGNKTITSINVGLGQFTYTEAGAAVSGTKDVYVFETTEQPYAFEQEAANNAWAASASREYDGWPPSFHYTVGGPTNTLHRITQRGEVGLFWSSEGLWRLTGTGPSDWQLRPFPDGGENVRLFAPRTIADFPDASLGLAEDGLVRVTESSFSTGISRQVEEVLRKFYSSTQGEAANEALREATKQYAFAVADLSDNAYWLFLPDETSSTPGKPTQAYIYTVNKGWTRSERAALTALYNRRDQRLYFAPVGGTTIERERKSHTPADYRESNGSGVDFDVEFIPFRGQSASNDKQWVAVQVNVENTTAIPEPAEITLGFTTSNNAHGVEYASDHVPYGDGVFRTTTPLEVCRGREMGLNIRHNTAGEHLRVRGVAVSWNEWGEALKSGK
jgi:hypothetical protein